MGAGVGLLRRAMNLQPNKREYELNDLNKRFDEIKEAMELGLISDIEGRRQLISLRSEAFEILEETLKDMIEGFNGGNDGR